MIKIYPERIFGDKLDNNIENCIKGIANCYKCCYFEKEVRDDKWFLTIKNIKGKFNITEYINKLKVVLNFYKESLLTFPETEEICTQHQIQSEFSKRVCKYVVFKNKNLKTHKFCENRALNYIIEELFKLIDKTFVNEFFINIKEYKFNKSNVVCISNFCEELNVDHFLYLINHWKNDIQDNYSSFFKSYKIFNLKRKIFIVFKKKNTTPI